MKKSKRATPGKRPARPARKSAAKKPAAAKKAAKPATKPTAKPALSVQREMALLRATLENMSQGVAMYDGDLYAAPCPSGGFHVAARLPFGEPA